MKEKVKVGDRVRVPHIGVCMVLDIYDLPEMGVQYVLRYGDAVFTVEGQYVQKVKEAEK